MTNEESYELLLTLKSTLKNKSEGVLGVSFYVDALECALKALAFCYGIEEFAKRYKDEHENAEK